MRAILIASALVSAAMAGASVAAPADDFANAVAGPWGRVDISWMPYTGVLAKNSCPATGVRQPSTIGLFGEGGSMWLEATTGGALKVHDGNPVARRFEFVRLETASAAVYREGTVERRLSLVAVDRLSEERLPLVAGMPAAKYLRCKTKK
jgi:hypothetical protein